MLKQAAKDAIKAMGFDVDKLIEGIKADAEVDVVIPEGTLIKTADLEARDVNKMAEGKRLGETEGEKKGRELAAKALKKKFALADDVPADIDKVVEAVHTQVGKGDVGLKEQIALLQKDKETLATEKTQLQLQAKASSFDSTLISSFPANRAADLTDAERLVLLKSALTFEEVEGKQVVKKNGEILRDKTTQNPIPASQAITDYFTERKWIAPAGPGGRGGGDNPAGGGGAGMKSLTKFTEKWKAENPSGNPISPEFDAALATHAKDIPDFDYMG